MTVACSRVADEEEEEGEGVLGVVVRLQLRVVVDVLRYPGVSSMAAPRRWFSSGWWVVLGKVEKQREERKGGGGGAGKVLGFGGRGTRGLAL